MQRVTLVAAMDNTTAYGQHAIALVHGLSALGYHVSVRAIRANESSAKIPVDVKERFVHGVQPEGSEILLHHPDFMPTPGKETAYLTTWDSTRLPRKYVDILNRAKVVVVPSEWNANCFSASGVDTPIRVVPLGIAPNVFGYRNFPKDKPFVFGCGGRLLHGMNRKGIHSLIRLFQVAFDDQDVRLRIKCSSDDPISPPPDSRIELLKTYLTDGQLAEWYGGIHCYVSFATGSFELMPLQAMAVGRPVLGMKYGGMAEYLSDADSFIVDHRLGPAEDKWAGMGSWGRVEDTDVINSLRAVRERLAMVHEKGWSGHGTAKEFSWGRSVNELLRVMREFDLVATNRPVAAPSMPKCFVQLGRYGDIVNILPILREEERFSGQKPIVVVAREFASVLDGVSYAKPMIWEGDVAQVTPAIEHARQVFQNVVVTQVSGEPSYSIGVLGDSHSKDQWRLAGYADQFDNLPLYFDRRNFEREKALADDLMDYSRTNVVVGLSGHSSPFPHTEAVMKVLTGIDANVVDISAIIAHRPYDLLGLFERATLLILSDSAPLHLAAACNTPAIAFIADSPSLWHGMAPRGRLLLKIAYRAVPVQLAGIVTAVESLANPPRLLHCYQEFHGRGDSWRRNEVARRTWRTMYTQDRWVPCGVSEGALPRMFPDDRRTLPFVRDIIEQGVTRSTSDNDVIVLSNTDSCFSSSISEAIRDALKKRDSAFSYRIDFDRLTEPLSLEQIASGKPYPGSDLFVFKVSWWRQKGGQFPDMVLGGEGWDWCLRELIRSTGGVEIRGHLYHERHETEWEVHRFTLACNKHNHAVARPFLKKLGVYSGEFEQ